jgi:hypothetical protein
MIMQTTKTALDTLDSVAEDSERLYGGPTGKKPMRTLGHMGPIEDEQPEDKPKKGAAAARFPRAAIKILKDWLVVHIDHPYPTEEEKELLKEQTGLTISQISNWMANTRRRQKVRPKRSASPSIRPSTQAIDIPAGKTWETMGAYTSQSDKSTTPTGNGRFFKFRIDRQGGPRSTSVEVAHVLLQQDCMG